MDLKLDNIIYDPLTKNVSIIDFGLSKILNSSEVLITGSIGGTVFYLPPEFFEKKEHNKSYNPQQVDYWYLGVTFYTLLMDVYPFKLLQDQSRPLYSKIIYPTTTSKKYKKIINNLLSINPKNRSLNFV